MIEPVLMLLALYLVLLFVVVPIGVLYEKIDAIRHRYGGPQPRR